MAEAFLKQLGANRFEAESAGIEPGTLNLNVIAVMKEVGIDISNNGTNGVLDLVKNGNTYDVVVTVCNAASAERCPVFPGMVKRLSWSFADPSQFTGTKEEILQQTRTVRDEIKQKVETFINEAGYPECRQQTESLHPWVQLMLNKHN